jgi:hypothetical protein
MDRSPDMAAFLTASAHALRASCRGRAADVAELLISRWNTSAGNAGSAAARLPVCDWVPPALAGAAPERRDLADAFGAIEGRLRWTRRKQADPGDTRFWNGHANAIILGPGGMEDRDDLWAGATVMAPGVRYADHDHPPEEVYLSLSAGEWWNADMDWTDPGPTGFVYNPPGIAHAMRAGEGPFLALWYLPL